MVRYKLFIRIDKLQTDSNLYRVNNNINNKKMYNRVKGPPTRSGSCIFSLQKSTNLYCNIRLV